MQDANQRLDSVEKTLSDIAKQVAKGDLDDATLAALQTQVDEIESELGKGQDLIETQLSNVRDSLTELGTAPGPGEPPEPAVTTDERNQLLAQRSEINAVSDKSTKLTTSANALSNEISTKRREYFKQTLFKHTALIELFSTDFRPLMKDEVDNFAATYGAWLTYVWEKKRVEFALSIVISAFAAFFLYRLSGKFVERTKIDFQEEEPDYVARLLVAFWTTMVPIIVLVVFLIASFILLESMNVLLPDARRFVGVAFAVFAIITFAYLLSRNTLAPGRPQWRLLPISDSAARKLTLALTTMVAVNWLDRLFAVLNDTLNADVHLEVMRNLITAVLIGSILIAISFIKLRAGEGTVAPGRGLLNFLRPSFIRLVVRLGGGFVVLSALTGYVSLARFAAMQVVLTGAVLITTYIGILVGQAVAQPGGMMRTSFGRRFVERFSLSAVRADQLSLVAGLVTYVVALVIGITLLLLSWGVRFSQIRLWAENHLTAIKLGSISISLGGIFIGILLFIGAFLATRWFEKWFDSNVLLRSRADAGVRNSVKTGINYLGIVLAGLLAISAAGVNLSSLALVASALSIGIGFGLQTIVSNFVSGLILLVERPFKVGDWIVSGSAEGFVKRISVRATEIETFQRQSIIVPNSELINASVGNWMHHNQMGRSEVAVGVSYDADPRKVMEILMEIGTSHPLVLQNPEPMVIFVGFGESSLDFEVRVYLADIFNGITVRNDIRVAIYERFKAEGISIPFPQRDLHIVSGGGQTDALAQEIEKRVQRAKESGIETDAKPAYDHPDAGNDDDGAR
ncbi:mechanosensitive ion channel domain-containing protein [Martelella endophytica]|uniref:mechanosensitive ion channel domain-containing protein n=1 Tax=Martelella endophytica TaxID=1486262 RepID=UPI001184DC95|nr:mechanosensitive ion channel domain-containing protein [Martelella endophytica]